MAPETLAQNGGPDTDPDGAQGYVQNTFQHSRFDSINEYNGQLTIPIPLGPEYPIGPNLKLQTVLTYNSRVWEYGDSDGTNLYTPLAGDPALGIGWTLTLGRISLKGGPSQAGAVAIPYYLAPDGSERRFVAAGTDGTGKNVFKTSDGSQYYLRDMGFNGPYEMWDGDGNHYMFDWQVSGYDDGPSGAYFYIHDFGHSRDGFYLTSVSDPFGNSYLVSYFDSGAPCAYRYQGADTSCLTTTMRCPTTGYHTWIPASITLPSGRAITVFRNASQMIDRIDFPVWRGAAGGNATATWTFTNQSAVIRNNLCATAPLKLLSAITLPSSTGSYSFDYSGGYLTAMTFPTGATVGYTWRQWFFYHSRVARLPGNCSPIDPDSSQPIIVNTLLGISPPGNAMTNAPISPCSSNPDRFLDWQFGIDTRTLRGPGVVAGVTRYVQYAFPFGEQGTFANPSAGNSQTLTVVLSPDGSAKSTLFHSSPARGVARPDYRGDRTGAPVRELVYAAGVYTPPSTRPSMGTCLSGNDQPFCPNHAIRMVQRSFDYDDALNQIGNRRVLSETTFYGAPVANGSCPNCQTRSVTYSLASPNTWEGNGRHYDRESHGGTVPNSGRTITTVWAPDFAKHLLNLVSARTITDASGTAPSSVTTAYNHDTVNRNGFLTQTTVTDPQFGTVTTGFTNDGSGNPGTVTLHGSGTGFNSLAPDYRKTNTFTRGLLATSAWGYPAPLSWKAVDRTLDATTGRIMSSRDTAGLQTSFEYDDLMRVTRASRPAEHPDVVIYDSPVQTTVTRGSPADVATHTWIRYEYDGLGRLIRETRKVPSGDASLPGAFATRSRSYDAMGRLFFASEWQFCPTRNDVATCPSVTSVGTTFSDFDPFGRARIVTKADGTVTTRSFTDASVNPEVAHSDTAEKMTVTVSGQAASTTTYRDAFGRVIRVDEPNVGDGEPVRTDYRYNVLDKLGSVSQTSSTGNQSRSFTYDAFGFPRSETHPEVEGWIRYSDYDATGHAWTKKLTDAGGALKVPFSFSYTFDGAGRLLTASANGTTFTVNTYDVSQLPAGACPTSYAAGKLTRQDGYNPGLGGNYLFSESFCYGDGAGRLTAQVTNVGADATQRFAYNGLGLVTTHVHPSVLESFSTTTGYMYGLPTSISASSASGGFRTVISSATYNAAGVLASHTAGSGVKTTVSPDTVPARPYRISTSGASSNFDTGVYSYDGAGNVMAMGMGGSADTFSYDGRSRLISSLVRDAAGVGHGETFLYDRFGNLKQRTVAERTPNTIGLTVDPLTNRLVTSGASYDAMGNLTRIADPDGGVRRLGYDAMSRHVTSTWEGSSGSEQYRYNGAGERLTRDVLASRFYTAPPCRLLDTRLAGWPTNGAPLYGQTELTIGAVGRCSIPQNAVSLTTNVTYVAPSADGALQAYPAGTSPRPTASITALRAGLVRATQAMIGLDATAQGRFSLFSTQPWPQYSHVIVDVSGYFLSTRTTHFTLRDPQSRLLTEYRAVYDMSGAGILPLTLVKESVWFGNLLAGTYTPGTGWRYYASDHLGTPRLVTNDAGTTVAQYKYRPYGQALGAGPVQGTDFAGMEKDGYTGSHYDHARYYAGAFGRFNAPDALGGRPQDPQSWNRYTYARNNPLKYVDPDGRNSSSAFLIAASGGVGTVSLGPTALLVGSAFVVADIIRPNSVILNAIAEWVVGLHSEKAAGDEAGVYEFPDAKEPGRIYVGQSGDVPRRIGEHEDSGKKDADSSASVKPMPGSTKGAREKAEQERINELGGKESVPGSQTSNKVNPVGPQRQKTIEERYGPIEPPTR